MKIHIADDDLDIADTTALLLETMGHVVTTSVRADQIHGDVKRCKPDVLLQDVHMPGLELEDHIADMRADPDLAAMPVLLFTATTDGTDLWREVGADGLVAKPFDVDAMEHLLEDVYRLRGGSEGSQPNKRAPVRRIAGKRPGRSKAVLDKSP